LYKGQRILLKEKRNTTTPIRNALRDTAHSLDRWQQFEPKTMRITFLLFFLTILSCSENRTDFEKYNELEQKAMLELTDEQYEKALSNFEKAINLKPKEDVSIYFNATASALNAGKFEKAKELLIASIHNTNASKDYFLNFDKFDEFVGFP
jgi:tetratricopeptide (TPR) repeat protein